MTKNQCERASREGHTTYANHQKPIAQIIISVDMDAIINGMFPVPERATSIRAT